MFDESFWTLVAFVLFIGIAVYFKLPAALARVIDDRTNRIRRELEEAHRLRLEAQMLLADYQRKQHQMLTEAEAIVSRAGEEAERLRASAEADLNRDLARRVAMAERRISQAEAAAATEVREAMVALAVAATRDVLKDKLKGGEAAAVLDRAVTELRARLN